MTALTLDFETRSPRDIKRSSYRSYIMAPEAGIMCVGTQFVEEPEARVWVPPMGRAVFEPRDPCPEPILLAIEKRIPIYAHNAPFDRRVYRWHAMERLGWPEIPEELWRCTAAICSYYALPRKLKEVAEILALPVQKDMTGHRIMLQLTKPKKPTKNFLKKWDGMGMPRLALPVQWDEAPQKLAINAEYCRKDVETQTCLLRKLGPLPLDRLKDWQKDQEINERGVYVDFGSLLTTQSIIAREMDQANTEMQHVTTGITGVPVVMTVNQRDKILVYLEMQGIDLLSLRKADVVEALQREDLGVTARRVLELRQAAGKASIKKVVALLENVDEDWRARDALVWHKASTGRWAGARWQPQNLPREAMKDDDAEEFHRILAHEMDPPQFYADRTLGTREEFFSIMSSALRSFLRAPPGRTLLVSDFASIESRVLAWLSGCKTMLDAYHKKECVYSQFASRIYGRPITGKGPERQLGKVAVLGLGYGMGEDKFIETAATDPRTPDISVTEEVKVYDYRAQQIVTKQLTKGKVIVDLYRKTYKEVPELWRMTEAALTEAIQNQTSVRCGLLTYGCRGEWAWVVLPSGRPLWYYQPEITRVPSRWKQGQTEMKISHMTIDAKTKKWVRRTTWGGTLVENCLAGDTAVLTSNGVKRLDRVTLHDRVWDGEVWVGHFGLIPKGIRPTLVCEGVRMTADHQVWVGRWEDATNVKTDQAVETYHRHLRSPLRDAGGREVFRVERQARDLGTAVRLWESQGDDGEGVQEGENQELWVRERSDDIGESEDARRFPSPAVRRLEVYAGPLFSSVEPGIQKLRGEGHHRVRPVGGILRKLPGGHAGRLQAGSGDGPYRQQRALRENQCAVDYHEGECFEHTVERVGGLSVREGNSVATGRDQWSAVWDDTLPLFTRVARRGSDPTPGYETVYEKVYDLMNCGPRHCFTVVRPDGRLFLVHNCVQATAADLLFAAIHRIDETGRYRTILSVHDEVVAEKLEGGMLDEFHHLMTVAPDWARGCPVEAESQERERYGK